MMTSVRRLEPKGQPAPRTFDACYEAHRRRVYHLCLRYAAGDAGTAEDLTQDVFVKLLEHLPSLEDPEDLGGWLYRVAANLAVSRARRVRALVNRFLPAYRRSIVDVEPAPDLLIERRQAAAAALASLGELPPRERVVLCMKLLDGESQRAIAATLGLTEGYVSKLYARAWERLRAAGWEGDDEAR